MRLNVPENKLGTQSSGFKNNLVISQEQTMLKCATQTHKNNSTQIFYVETLKREKTMGEFQVFSSSTRVTTGDPQSFGVQ